MEEEVDKFVMPGNMSYTAHELGQEQKLASLKANFSNICHVNVCLLLLKGNIFN